MCEGGLGGGSVYNTGRGKTVTNCNDQLLVLCSIKQSPIPSQYMSVCVDLCYRPLHDVIRTRVLPNGPEVVEVTCTVGWEVLLLCGYWNV